MNSSIQVVGNTAIAQPGPVCKHFTWVSNAAADLWTGRASCSTDNDDYRNQNPRELAQAADQTTLLRGGKQHKTISIYLYRGDRKQAHFSPDFSLRRATTTTKDRSHLC